MDERTDFEKFIDGTATLAKIVRSYYESLIETGFSETNALVLTIQYQNSVFEMARSDHNKKQGDE